MTGVQTCALPISSLNYDRLQTYVDAMSWTPRRWAWVDPLKEIEAAARGIELGLISPQQIIRERGEDPDEVLEDLADWQTATADLFPINGTGGTPANNDPNAAAAQAAADAATADAGNASAAGSAASKALAARRRFQLIASRHWDQT